MLSQPPGVIWPTWDQRTDEPIDTPLKGLTEARDREDHAARWGFWVYDALVGKWGREVAGKAAKATYERLLLNGYSAS